MIGALSDCDIEKNYDVIKSHTKKNMYICMFFIIGMELYLSGLF